jgi:nicotinate-nucleotide adenylyltransferase
MIKHPAHNIIGLLGGSFNPAHEGHVYISQKAKEHLQLDSLYWLVCPQNPLKSADNMASFKCRMDKAIKLTARFPFIEISNYEARFDTIRSIDTIKSLQNDFPQTQFIWLMGADHLPFFQLWEAWETIVETIPIAIFAREEFLDNLTESCLYKQYHEAYIEDPSQLKSCSAPAWAVIDIPVHPASATRIREANHHGTPIT